MTVDLIFFFVGFFYSSWRYARFKQRHGWKLWKWNWRYLVSEKRYLHWLVVHLAVVELKRITK